MLKKSIAFILAISIMLSLFQLTYAQDDVGTAMIGKLKAFGIVTEELTPDAPVSRGEFTAILVRMLKLDEVAQSLGGESPFRDVPYWNPYAPYIKLATEWGMVKGTGNGLFEPDTPITCIQAVRLIVNALGYAPVVQNEEEYPVVAQREKILEHVSFTADAPLSGKVAAQLVWNSLFVRLMESAGAGNYEITQKTLLKDYLEIQKGNGQVTGTKFANLYGSALLEDNEISIDLVVYQTELKNTANFLGKSVDFYYTTDDLGKRSLIYIEESEKNKTLLLELSDVSFAEQEMKLTYYGTNNKTKTAVLESNCAVIYNGVQEAIARSLFETECDGGYIRLTDSDGNGRYDVADIQTYNNYTVHQTNRQDKIIIPKDGAEPIYLNTADSDTEVLIANANGSTVDFRKLKEWDVISLSVSRDKTHYNLVRSIAKFRGRVSAITEEGEKKFLVIDGARFQFANQHKAPPELGDEGLFFLDAYGKIVNWDSTGTADGDYAYLIDMTEAGVFQGLQFKLFDQRDGVKVLEGADTVRIQTADITTTVKNDSEKGAETLRNLLASTKDETGTEVNQLVQYKVNASGKLVSLKTAKAGEDPANFSMDYTAAQVYCSGNGYVEGQYRVDAAQTIVFVIPGNRNENENYELHDYVESAIRYTNLKLYDVDDISRIAKAVVCYRDDNFFNVDSLTWSALGVVSEVAQTIVDNEPQYIITIYHNNAVTEFIVPMDEPITDPNRQNPIDPSLLQVGDVLQVLKTKDNKLAAAQYIYKMDNPEASRYVFGNPGNVRNDNIRMHGSVRNMSGNYLVMNEDGGRCPMGTVSNASIYVVSANRKEPTVRFGSKEDLIPGRELVVRKGPSAYNEIIIFD